MILNPQAINLAPKAKVTLKIVPEKLALWPLSRCQIEADFVAACITPDAGLLLLRAVDTQHGFSWRLPRFSIILTTQGWLHTSWGLSPRHGMSQFRATLKNPSGQRTCLHRLKVKGFSVTRARKCNSSSRTSTIYLGSANKASCKRSIGKSHPSPNTLKVQP